ncbi:MAG: hypothetical protein ACYTGX_06355 [Planctomycetota bacterium]
MADWKFGFPFFPRDETMPALRFPPALSEAPGADDRLQALSLHLRRLQRWAWILGAIGVAVGSLAFPIAIVLWLVPDGGPGPRWGAILTMSGAALLATLGGLFLHQANSLQGVVEGTRGRLTRYLQRWVALGTVPFLAVVVAAGGLAWLAADAGVGTVQFLCHAWILPPLVAPPFVALWCLVRYGEEVAAIDAVNASSPTPAR